MEMRLANFFLGKIYFWWSKNAKVLQEFLRITKAYSMTNALPPTNENPYFVLIIFNRFFEQWAVFPLARRVHNFWPWRNMLSMPPWPQALSSWSPPQENLHLSNALPSVNLILIFVNLTGIQNISAVMVKLTLKNISAFRQTLVHKSFRVQYFILPKPRSHVLRPGQANVSFL